MQPSEVSELHYLFPSNPTLLPSHFPFTGMNTPVYDFNRLSNPHQLQITPHVQAFNPQTTCLSSNSTSDEADEQQLSIINERKQRRMISNRESARRSRMRKQKHLDELWSQVIWLRNENHQLIDKLNHVSERHDKVLQENAQLKEEASELRQMFSHMQLNSPYPSLRLDEEPCDELV
ncbi:basic leucine zipper 43-like [Andrographis paniculata]|uniref:basic leucine zipper 43-like n=1 Tax=Andrographis paniculata TaxID=175694 RepID=UPI0021E9899D|nr:basic leucine zipper 43-like [Andrographis paniculata]